MKTITLQILAEDIRNSSYFNQEGCAITKALQRINPRLRDQGLFIINEEDGIEIICPSTLSDKICMMYKHVRPFEMSSCWNPLEPQDFTYDLEVPDNWIE